MIVTQPLVTESYTYLIQTIMKKIIIFLALLLFTSKVGVALSEDVYSATNQLSDLTATPYYLAIAGKMKDLFTNVGSCSNAEAALGRIGSSDTDAHNSLANTNRADWKNIRFQAAFTVLTNLSLIEETLKATEIAETVSVKPPKIIAHFGNQEIGVTPMPDVLVTNAADRERLLAYRSALQAVATLDNARKALIVQYDYHREHTLGAIVDAYTSAPADPAEIRKLIGAFSNTACALQFSNRLNSVNK